MSGPIVLSEKTINKMADEAGKRVGLSVIRVKEAIEKITVEELIVRGLVASIKEGQGGKNKFTSN